MFELIFFRNAPWHPRNFPSDSTRKTSDDVLRDTGKRNPTNLQEIHARCKYIMKPTADWRLVVFISCRAVMVVLNAVVRLWKSTLAVSRSCAGCRFQIFFLLAPQFSLVLSLFQWCNCHIARNGFLMCCHKFKRVQIDRIRMIRAGSLLGDALQHIVDDLRLALLVVLV